MTREYYALIVLTPEIQAEEVIKCFLTIDKLKIEVASSYQAGLTALKDHNFDLMFVAVNPHMDKTCVAELLQEAVLVYSVALGASFTAQDNIDLFKMGVAGILKLPLTPVTLLSEVNKFAMGSTDCVGFK